MIAVGVGAIGGGVVGAGSLSLSLCPHVVEAIGFVGVGIDGV